MDNEKNFGKGAIEQVRDKRDLAFSTSAPFDWELGFDIEMLLGYRAKCDTEEQFWGVGGRKAWGVERYRKISNIVRERGIQSLKLPIKNQGSSSSCTGQGLSYYLEVLNYIETGKYLRISAKDIYAYISIGEGKGAYLRDALKLAVNRGIGSEKLVPSYFGGNPLSEKQYLEKPEETEELKAIRSALRGKEYQGITSWGEELMEKMAWAMLMGFGNYFAVNGENGKGWMTEYPSPPSAVAWAHALFGGKAGLDNGEKFLGHINSWGDNCGVDGWQKLKLKYFTSYNIRSPWTLIDEDNNWNMTKSNIKIIKDKNSPSVGIWLPALSPEALESYCLNFGIEVPRKEDGSIDWDVMIEGEMELKS